MNVYDFDNTIYRGESAFDFFVFCIRKKPSLLKVLLPVIRDAFLYKACRMDEAQFRERGAYYTESFFNLFDDIHAVVNEFWDSHEHKIKPFYEKVRREDDVIVTANVNVLVDEIFRRMKIKNYICTVFDMDSGRLESICFSGVKAELFRQSYGDSIDDLYTDSKNDLPLMEMSKRVFMVKNDRVFLVDKSKVRD